MLSLPVNKPRETGSVGVPADVKRYVSFALGPDGSTSLSPDRQWSLTLVLDSPALDTGKLPENFRAVLINPLTGSVSMY